MRSQPPHPIQLASISEIISETLVKLYCQILDYLARVFRRLSRGTPVRYSGDVTMRDDWDDLIEKTQDLETAYEKDFERIRYSKMLG